MSPQHKLWLLDGAWGEPPMKTHEDLNCMTERELLKLRLH